MIRIIFIIFLFFSSAAHAAEKKVIKTIIHDRAEAELLLGKHSFSTISLGLYCYSPECLGQTIIYKKDGLYFIAGGHVSFSEEKSLIHWHGGHIFLKGIITEIHSKSFTFKGDIDTERFSFGKWYPCIRKGTFIFTRDLDIENRADHDEDFWRLYAQETPEGCDMDADTSSIDMFVERLSP